MDYKKKRQNVSYNTRDTCVRYFYDSNDSWKIISEIVACLLRVLCFLREEEYGGWKSEKGKGSRVANRRNGRNKQPNGRRKSWIRRLRGASRFSNSPLARVPRSS